MDENNPPTHNDDNDLLSSNTLFQKQHKALIVCDLQGDALQSIPQEQRKTLVAGVRAALATARLANWTVVFVGLQFSSGYKEVPLNHKLFGGLKRLNGKLGDQSCHWFLQGHEGAEVLASLVLQDEQVVYRQQHLPCDRLLQLLQSRGVTQVTLIGCKASGAIQSTAQALCDVGLEVVVVSDCIADDCTARCNAILNELLPIYATILTLREIIEDTVGLKVFFDQADDHAQQDLMQHYTVNEKGHSTTNVGRRGHGHRYIQLLLERPGWYTYPTQPWYAHMGGGGGGEYHCPLGKKVVDFCDEPQFSKVSMYIAGREYLDEKDKVVEFAESYMPKTYCWEANDNGGGSWLNDLVPPTDEEEGATSAPWFVKEADKNLGGEAIGICHKPSEISQFIKPNQRYVVQQHVKDPLLTDDGRKAHLKFYILLICNEDGVSWTLYTYRGALLSISPNLWSPEDLSQDTQVTIHRHPQPPSETDGWKQHWDATYAKCQEATLEVIEKAIVSGRLKGRPGKKQFEVFSADWMPDTHGNIWLFEFNMSPAVCQQEFDDASQRDARRDMLMSHDEAMLREALYIVLPWNGGATGESSSLWDLVGKCKGKTSSFR